MAFTLQQAALYQRIQAFLLDSSEAQLTFSQRLARDNRWTLNYTQRVIEEYKKFVFLAIASGHSVTPSEQVDQVWHLHLTYTHSYWDEFCRHVLQTPLHHGPTKGGFQEKQRFHEQYEQTLVSYRRFFGEPPADIWFPPHIRFGHDIHFVRVNTQDYWLIPRLSFRQWFPDQLTQYWQLLILSMGLLILGGCRASESVEWFSKATLAEFLGLYGLIAVLGLFIAATLSRLWQVLHPNSNGILLSVAIIALTEAVLCFGHISVRMLTLSGSDFLWCYGFLIGSTLLLDRWFCQWATSLAKPAQSVNSFAYESTPWLVWLFWLGVYGLGIARIGIGISRQQPVGFLALLSMCIAGYMFLFLRDRRFSKNWLSHWLIQPVSIAVGISVVVIIGIGFFSIVPLLKGVHFFWWIVVIGILLFAIVLAIGIFIKITSLELEAQSTNYKSLNRSLKRYSSSHYPSNRYSSNSSSKRPSFSQSGSSSDHNNDNDNDTDSSDAGCGGCGGCGCD